MAAEDRRIKALLNDARTAADSLLEHVDKGEGIIVISHSDADGLAASGIMGASLKRIGATFRIRIERWLDENVAREIASEKDCLTILTDMGSGYLNVLNNAVEEKSLIILDHHQPTGKAAESFIHVNPHLHGIDGSRDLSGSGVAYLVAKELSDGNVDFSCVGLVGALGDLQDKYGERRLGGVNEIIVKDAVEAGHLQTETDLLFFGRETRPIHKALAYTTSPFIPGISGEEDKSLAFLLGLGIKPKEGDKWRALRDLSQEEKRKIFSALSEYLAFKGFKSDVATSLLGTVYVLKREDHWTPLRDAREFALLLNATARTGRPSLGVAICMGDRGACLEGANKALEEYRQTIMRYLRWIEENPDRIEELESIYVLHGEQAIDEKVISAISTILSTGMANSQKPIIAYSAIPEEGLIKISARTVEMLTGQGLNLGEIVRIAAEKCEGTGGGHNIAAGAQVPYGQKMCFLKAVDDLVKEHLQKLKTLGS